MINIVDQEILKLLQNNARIPNSDIAKKLDKAPSAIWERIKKLEERKVIQKYATIIDPIAVDRNILVFVTIGISSTNWSDECAEQLKSIKYIEELHEIVDQDSYIAKVRVKDMQELSDVLKYHVAAIAEVKSTKTMVVIKSIKENPIVSLD